jgi:hypothetical protein
VAFVSEGGPAMKIPSQSAFGFQRLLEKLGVRES